MKKRIRDLVIEVLVATTLVCALLFWADHGPRDPRVAFEWIGLAAWTAFVFGYPLVRLRPYWRRVFFWLPLAVLLAIHLTAYAILFRRGVVNMGSLVIFLISMVEMQLILAALKWAVLLWGSPRARGGER